MTVTPAMASRIEMWPLDRLKPYQRNARTHSDTQVAQIAASIVEFGFTAPLLVSDDGGILAGHGRLAAARKLDLDAVPVVVLDHLTPTQRRAYILADNQLALQAGWDQELLAVELADLSAAGFDLALTGFSDEELADLLGDIEETERADEAAPIAEPEDEDIPEAPANPVSQPGDIWQLGAHRLICGDSIDPAVVAALMAGDRASLCFTSPPYGQQRNYTQGIADWDALMRGVFANLPMAGDGQVLVNLGLIHRDNEVIPYWDGWISWMRTQGWRRFGWYVWDQGPGMPGDWAGRLAPSFEFVFHFNRQSRKPNKIVPCKHAGQDSHLRADGSSTAMRGKDGEVGGWTHAGQPTQDYRIPDSVIRVMRHKGKIGRDIDHPAVFPVALPEHILLAYSDPGDVVFEPFGGSGTTILAAQKTNRVARAIELAPSYTDVAVKRFQQNHPDIPVTLLATGQTFAEVESERLENTDASLAR
ncbi:site-specific DNA-methyltransferase [Diaphorobacter sp. JS3050]|uniref:site-specific DNA-methyltransferase n=1 Tax=Diaphorobacter sp. JS3050 TaxID=2735554 RepID=UPI00155383E7|nr:site-specific DNA-methyltransferase [Diaphorobacter sp. JS3050]QJY32197.1 site-specific DNA-methyltransferase [Diaphorobacter sp. JS3050]